MSSTKAAEGKFFNYGASTQNFRGWWTRIHTDKEDYFNRKARKRAELTADVADRADKKIFPSFPYPPHPRHPRSKVLAGIKKAALAGGW